MRSGSTLGAPGTEQGPVSPLLCRNKGIADMIAQAVEQIRNTVSLSVLDESATKQGVVLRLLSLAGWDTFDISQVVPEYTVGTRRVDYALRPGSPKHRVHRGPSAPAKTWKDINSSCWSTAFQEGVKLAVLTNGRTWWLYLPLQAGSWEQRRFLTIDLEVQEPSVVESRFLEYLSPERVGSGQAGWRCRSPGGISAAGRDYRQNHRRSLDPRSSKLPMNSWLT